MSNLLLDEQPLLVMPKLARKIGLNEAIILQQIHYWNEINKKTNNNFKDGFYWTYNSYEEWQKQFPFWHRNTIVRIIGNLQLLKLIVVGNYNKVKIDRTKWYRVDYDALQILEESPLHHIGTTNIQKWYDHLTKIVSPIPEINSKIIKDIKNIYIVLPNDDTGFIKIYKKYYQQKFGKEHMRVTEEQLSFINNQIDLLQSVDIDIETWREQVEYHFDNLPVSNNGNIIAFLHASFRYFEVG